MKGKKTNVAPATIPHKAEGGAIANAGGNPNVFQALRKRKAGGRVGKTLGAIGGGVASARLDRPGRKTGGRVGANSAPLSNAAKPVA